ncbi:uncharacterized protein LOC126977992 [Leptidea sinapis]|uniref:uncharacterized protein LOC126977992 n=1 Tax=Leptidea sinapis TaxID=189913 RepID=UPI00213D95EA|nr:uncharacterized protein LOC126977992 [Leptidea sinapis]
MTDNILYGIGGNEKKVYILDGGFSSQLSRHVGTTADSDPLWTSRFLNTHPEDVVKTHLDFIRAGSDIISTNTYQASVGAFLRHLGVSSDEAYGLIQRAVRLAQKARIKYSEECKLLSISSRNILIAGSVGPYGAALNDGSEYSGSYTDLISEETMKNWHRPRIEALLQSEVDFLAIETIPCEKEALVLVNMLKDYPSAKAWISVSCKDDTSLSHGENFQEVARKCWESNHEQLIAVGMNCCSPKWVANLVRNIGNIPIVAYPNSGEKWDPGVGWKDDQCEPLCTFVPEWLQLNVQYIGGCCRTYSEDIAAIRNKVEHYRDNINL